MAHLKKLYWTFAVKCIEKTKIKKKGRELPILKNNNQNNTFKNSSLLTVWPYWAIYWTLGNFLKSLATINVTKSPIFLDNFCKGVKIYHFSSEIF